MIDEPAPQLERALTLRDLALFNLVPSSESRG